MEKQSSSRPLSSLVERYQHQATLLLAHEEISQQKGMQALEIAERILELNLQLLKQQEMLSKAQDAEDSEFEHIKDLFLAQGHLSEV